MQKNINSVNLLLCKEVMQKLRIDSVNTIKKMIKNKQLKPIKVSGGKLTFFESDIITLLEELRNGK